MYHVNSTFEKIDQPEGCLPELWLQSNIDLNYRYYKKSMWIHVCLQPIYKNCIPLPGLWRHLWNIDCEFSRLTFKTALFNLNWRGVFLPKMLKKWKSSKMVNSGKFLGTRTKNQKIFWSASKNKPWINFMDHRKRQEVNIVSYPFSAKIIAPLRAWKSGLKA